MKKIFKTIFVFLLTLSLFSVSGHTNKVMAYGNNLTVQAASTTPGIMYGPLRVWISDSDILHPIAQFNDLNKAAKPQIIAMYGYVDRNKSYYVMYYNEVVPAGWGYSQKGYIRNVRVII